MFFEDFFLEAVTDNHVNQVFEELILVSILLEFHEKNARLFWRTKHVEAFERECELSVDTSVFDHLD